MRRARRGAVILSDDDEFLLMDIEFKLSREPLLFIFD